MVYRVGSHGSSVNLIQRRLASLGLYKGPVDGNFGGGTDAALRAYQKKQGLTVDGVVGEITWKKLFPSMTTPSDPVPYNLNRKVLELTGTFETSSPPPECFSAINGDFDGQGISFGALQWNLGQGTLQALLSRMAVDHQELMSDIFGLKYPELVRNLLSTGNRKAHVIWSKTIQDSRGRIIEPWLGYFKVLGRTTEFQQIQIDAADVISDRAASMTREYGLKSQRAIALMFDIVVQNGGIPNVVKSRILRERKNNELDMLFVIADCRADAVNPRWVEDVRARKQTIAAGAGVVHGRYYNLESQYGITLDLV